MKKEEEGGRRRKKEEKVGGLLRGREKEREGRRGKRRRTGEREGGWTWQFWGHVQFKEFELIDAENCLQSAAKQLNNVRK
jgi:hypothetical protein